MALIAYRGGVLHVVGQRIGEWANGNPLDVEKPLFGQLELQSVDEGRADGQGVVQIIPQPLVDVVLTDELPQRTAALHQSGLVVEQTLTDVVLD